MEKTNAYKHANNFTEILSKKDLKEKYTFFFSFEKDFCI
jgi:alkyl hydroperoxide reductase subunit AhpC